MLAHVHIFSCISSSSAPHSNCTLNCPFGFGFILTSGQSSLFSAVPPSTAFVPPRPDTVWMNGECAIKRRWPLIPLETHSVYIVLYILYIFIGYGYTQITHTYIWIQSGKHLLLFKMLWVIFTVSVDWAQWILLLCIVCLVRMRIFCVIKLFFFGFKNLECNKVYGKVRSALLYYEYLAQICYKFMKRKNGSIGNARDIIISWEFYMIGLKLVRRWISFMVLVCHWLNNKNVFIW